jgi:hypothetical protein
MKRDTKRRDGSPCREILFVTYYVTNLEEVLHFVQNDKRNLKTSHVFYFNCNVTRGADRAPESATEMRVGDTPSAIK